MKQQATYADFERWFIERCKRNGWRDKQTAYMLNRSSVGVAKFRYRNTAKFKAKAKLLSIIRKESATPLSRFIASLRRPHAFRTALNEATRTKADYHYTEKPTRLQEAA